MSKLPLAIWLLGWPVVLDHILPADSNNSEGLAVFFLSVWVAGAILTFSKDRKP